MRHLKSFVVGFVLSVAWHLPIMAQVAVSGTVENRNQHLVIEWGLECRADICFRLYDSQFPAIYDGMKKNMKMLDLLTGEYLEFVWITPSVAFNRTNTTCYLRDESGEKVSSCDLVEISKILAQ